MPTFVYMTRCDGCGECVDICPSDIMHIDLVDIDDNGPGIPEEEMPRLFNLFASTKGARGTGLGLAVSRKIIGEHGGEIQVENRPGAGCRFRLTWPLDAVADATGTGTDGEVDG